jgi:ABC-type phosphate transport system substrate-binding protein
VSGGALAVALGVACVVGGVWIGRSTKAEANAPAPVAPSPSVQSRASAEPSGAASAPVVLVGGSGTMIETILPQMRDAKNASCREISRALFTNNAGSLQALESIAVIDLPSVALMSHRFDRSHAASSKLRNLSVVEVYLGQGTVIAIASKQNPVASVDPAALRSVIDRKGGKWADLAPKPAWNHSQDSIAFMLPQNCASDSGTCASVSEALWSDPTRPGLAQVTNSRTQWELDGLVADVAKEPASLGFVSEYLYRPGIVKKVPIIDPRTNRELTIDQRFWAYLPLEPSPQHPRRLEIAKSMRAFTSCLLSREVDVALAKQLMVPSKRSLALQRSWLDVETDYLNHRAERSIIQTF